MNTEIRIANGKDSKIIADIIYRANQPVAKQFNITIENCPKHPSNCTHQWISGAIGNGDIFLILEYKNTPVGCVSFTGSINQVANIKRLAVLPEYQKKGFGKLLISSIEKQIQDRGYRKITLGVIDDNKSLVSWYQKYGFRFNIRKRFSHLPFKVCFMTKIIQDF